MATQDTSVEKNGNEDTPAAEGGVAQVESNAAPSTSDRSAAAGAAVNTTSISSSSSVYLSRLRDIVVGIEKRVTPIGAVLAALVTIGTFLGQLGVIPVLGGLYNGMAPWLYALRAVLVPLLIISVLALAIWGIFDLKHKRRAFWRLSAAGVLYLMAMAILLIRPTERIVAVLTYAPAPGGVADTGLAQELADYLRGSLNRPGGLIKAVGVARVPGESRAESARRIGAQLLVDGSYSLGRNSIETRTELYDVAAEQTVGNPEVRTLLPGDLQTSQQAVAAVLADRIDVASVITRRTADTGTLECASAYECYVVGRRYYLWFTKDGYSRAVDHYRASLAYDPQYARAYAGLAEAHVQLAFVNNVEGNLRESNALWEEAGKEAEEAVKLAPNLVESRRALIWVYRFKGLRQAAREEFDQIALFSPPRAGFTISSSIPITNINPSGDAESLWLLSSDIADDKTKVALLYEAISLKPDQPQIHHDLGVALFAQGKLAEAETELQRALDINPNMFYAHLALSAVYYTRATLHGRPTTPGASDAGGLVLRVEDYLALAKRHADIALEQLPSYSAAAFFKGNIMAAQGALQPGISLARGALAENPQTGAWYSVEIYDNPAMYAPSIRAFRQAIASTPDYVYSYNNLGRLYVGQGHLYEAMRAFEDAVALDRHFGTAWYNLSSVQTWLGLTEEAVVSARHAVSETAEWSPAHTQLGNALMHLAQDLRPDLIPSITSLAPVTATLQSDISGDLALPTPLPAPPKPIGCEASPPPESGPKYDVEALLGMADSSLRRALELNPRDTAARLALGQVLYDRAKLAQSNGQTEAQGALLKEARAQLEELAPQINEFDPQTHYLLGLLNWQDGRLDQAERELEQAFLINPGNDTYFLGYFALLQQREKPEAEELAARRLHLYGDIVSNHPEHPLHHATMATLYLAEGRLEEARQTFTRAITLDPASPFLRNTLGLYYYGQEQYAEAQQEFQAAVELAPGEPVYRGNVGDALKAQGDLASARGNQKVASQFYAQALDSYLSAASTRQGANYHLQIGNVYLAQGDIARAEAEYKQAGHLGDEGFNMLGEAYEAAGQYDNAQAAYKQAICLAPGEPIYYLGLADVLGAQGLYTEAVEQLKLAISINPTYAEAHNRLGLILAEDLDRPDEATAELTLATLLEPTSALYRFNLAHHLYTNGQYEEAVAGFQAALDVAPDDDPDRWEYLYYLGLSYIELKDYPAAAKALEQALSLNPNDAAANAWLAVAYYSVQDDRACAAMQKAHALAALSPDSEVQEMAETYAQALSQWQCP